MPKPAGEAYLTQGVAPWPCATYLHIRVGDADIAMSADYAGPVLSALTMLTMAARDNEEVTR